MSDYEKWRGRRMTRNKQDIIDDMRNIVKPRIAKMLLEANFEGYGKEDKAEFETEFEMVLTLAEKALEQEPVLDKIRAEIKEITPTYHNPDWSITDLVPKSEVLKLVNKYKKESEEV